MRRVAMLLIAVAIASVPARAQEPGSAEAVSAARELTTILSADLARQTALDLSYAMWPKLEAGFSDKLSSGVMNELRPEFDRLVGKFVVEAMRQDMPSVYARHFTVEELRQMIAFYRTPTSAKSIRLAAAVMDDFYRSSLNKREADLQREISEP